MPRSFLFLAFAGVFSAALSAQVPSDYVVVAAFGPEDPFDAAVRPLARHHDATVVRFDPADLEPVRAALIAADPRYVALVMRPEQIDFAFARRFLQLATELDEDPFVDFSFGYLTGRTAADAVALVERGIAREPLVEAPTIASVAGGVEESSSVTRPHVLRSAALDAVHLYCAGEDAFPETGRDREFLAAELPALAGRDAVMFIGHGLPPGVVGGPDFADLTDLRLDDAVVMNVACYTGVTHTFFEDDYQAGAIRREEVSLDESFCLALLRTGVVGYTAYLCPRPAGPELDTDLAALLADGLSLGEARRRDYDKTVLGFLGYGEARLQLREVFDGAEIGFSRDAVRDMMLEGATGGVLFGDPAVVPFAGLDGQSPVKVECESVDGGIEIRASAATRGLYLHCSDPTAKFDDRMAMKVYARVPLAEALVEDVVVDEVRLGSDVLPSRVIWAIEEDHGERFLQVKVNFPRRDRMLGQLAVRARVLTTDDPALARSRGGSVIRKPAVTADIRSSELQPMMVELARERQVSVEALQAALDASAVALGQSRAERGEIRRLSEFQSEGFRAVCVLLEVGHSHFRTWTLLQATWQPGDERHLLALASQSALPNFASWQVLKGLGVADTPEVRAYLMDRLAEEEDAGLFMSIAEGLTLLGVRDAAAPIGDRVLEFRDQWGGVERYLVATLGELGGPDAIDRLELIAIDQRAASWKSALSALDRLDSAAAARVRERRGVTK